MEENFEDLQQLLDSHNIPVVHPHFGFLELIKKQTHENTNSQIYAHFLECPVTEIRSAFLTTLLDLVIEKTGKKLKLFEPIIHRERHTLKGNRIDIVVDDVVRKTAIIIENKINHDINNDLIDYWETYGDYMIENRAGVLLTKDKTAVPDAAKSFFVNVTHLEWINKVERLLNLDEIQNNYRTFFHDFSNTIKNFSKMYDMNESAKFYFKNAKQLLKAKESIHQAHNFINTQFDYVSNEIGWETYGNNIEWRNFWDRPNHIDTYLTVLNEKLLNGELEFSIILELYREDKNRKDQLVELLKNHRQFDSNYMPVPILDFLHFQRKDYRITENDLERLGEIIVQKIREDFADMTVMAIEKLYPNKDISAWKDKFLGRQG